MNDSRIGHTPTRLEAVQDPSNTGDALRWAIYDPDHGGTKIGLDSLDWTQGDLAEAIVLRYNAHDALVAALELVAESAWIDYLAPRQREAVAEALALARGETAV